MNDARVLKGLIPGIDFTVIHCLNFYSSLLWKSYFGAL